MGHIFSLYAMVQKYSFKHTKLLTTRKRPFPGLIVRLLDLLGIDFLVLVHSSVRPFSCCLSVVS